MGAEGRVPRRCPLLSRHIRNLQADGLFCICLEVYTTSGAFPAFVVLPAGAGHAVFFCVLHQGAAVFHILCYVILSMRLEAPFGWFAAAMLYHVESSGLFLLPLLSNMDCSSINTTLAFWEKGRQSSPICDMIMSFQNTTILDTLYGSLAIAVIFIGIHASGNTNHCNRRLKGAFL